MRPRCEPRGRRTPPSSPASRPARRATAEPLTRPFRRPSCAPGRPRTATTPTSGRCDPDLGSLRTWLFSICRRVVIDLARARAARPPLSLVEPADRAATGNQFEQALLGWQLEEALRSVPDRQREVLVEVVVRGRPAGEVALHLDVPVGTVHSRVFYGLRALRVALEEMGWVDDR